MTALHVRSRAGVRGLLLLLSSIALAPAASAEPLADVQVRLDQTSLGAITGPDGRFLVSAVPPGTYVLIAQRLSLAKARPPSTRSMAPRCGALAPHTRRGS